MRPALHLPVAGHAYTAPQTMNTLTQSSYWTPPTFCAVRNGHIKRITDNDIRSSVLEVMSTNVSTTFISCPGDATKTLGIKLPFLVMLIKNLKKYFSFEVQVLDDKNVRRRFRASNYQVRAVAQHFNNPNSNVICHLLDHCTSHCRSYTFHVQELC